MIFMGRLSSHGTGMSILSFLTPMRTGGGPFADSDVDAFPVVVHLSRHVHEPVVDKWRRGLLEPGQVAGEHVVEGVGNRRP